MVTLQASRRARADGELQAGGESHGVGSVCSVWWLTDIGCICREFDYCLCMPESFCAKKNSERFQLSAIVQCYVYVVVVVVVVIGRICVTVV
jgi:hypothetical protein